MLPDNMSPSMLINLISTTTVSTTMSKKFVATATTMNWLNAHITTPPDLSEMPDLIHNDLVQFLFCILYTTVFVLGVFGNVLVCYVVLRNRAMQTVTNIFITNLALSDILLCVLAVPFTPLYTFMGRWAFGRTLCHLVSFAQGCSIYISTLTLTSIAIDRYFVIIYPFHPRMKISTCIAIIISIWTISLLTTLPYGMYMKVVVDVIIVNATNITYRSHDDNIDGSQTYTAAPNTTLLTDTYDHVLISSVSPLSELGNLGVSTPMTYCEENWPSEQYRKVFGSVTTILQFVLPFVIISICYIWVSIKLNQRARTKPGSKSSQREEADRDRKKRTNRMLIAMVAVFGLSWLPLNVVNIFDDFYEKSNEWRFYTLFFFVAHSIAMSSTCYNPFLYAWLNENFRKEFKNVLPCFNPSNNNIINLTRSYNRSIRNTGGELLHHGIGHKFAANDGGSMDVYDDRNVITQETTLSKDKLRLVNPAPNIGNGNCSGVMSAYLEPNLGEELLQSQFIDIQLSDRNARYHIDDVTEIKSKDEQIEEMPFCETEFFNLDKTLATNFSKSNIVSET